MHNQPTANDNMKSHDKQTLDTYDKTSQEMLHIVKSKIQTEKRETPTHLDIYMTYCKLSLQNFY